MPHGKVTPECGTDAVELDDFQPKSCDSCPQSLDLRVGGLIACHAGVGDAQVDSFCDGPGEAGKPRGCPYLPRDGCP